MTTTSSHSVSESGKDSSSAGGGQLETATLKKGLLWQQWDRFFSRWKERFFVLTRDYLACFKKGSSLGITEMGSFLYKVNLVDVEGLQWVDKKRDGVIAIKVGQDGQLLLWSPKGLDDWMFALRDAISRSKGRREALRKAHTLIPQISETGLLRRYRQAMTLQHTLSDSHVERSILHSSSAKDFSGSLRSSTEHQPTPHLGKRSQRISVLTDIVISGGGDSELDPGYGEPELCLRPRNAMGPRLAPQCASGSHTSLASLGKGIGLGGCGTGGSGTTGITASGFGYGTGFSFSGFSTGGGHGNGGQLYRPSPRSLQVSPALTQRSLYAQHVLSAPEIAPSPEMRQSKSAATNVTSEFSFIRPDSPISRNDSGNGSGSSGGGGVSGSGGGGSGGGGGGGGGTNSQGGTTTTSSLRSMREYHRSHSCSTQALSSSLGSNTGTPSHGTPRNNGGSGGGHYSSGMTDPTRPSSIYGQPSVTVEKSSLFVPKNALQLQQQHLMQPQAPLNSVALQPASHHQPDVVPLSYQQTKSPSIQHLASTTNQSGGGSNRDHNMQRSGSVGQQQQPQQLMSSSSVASHQSQQSIFEQRPHHQHRNHHRRPGRQYLHSKSDSSFANVPNNHVVPSSENSHVNNNGASNASHRKSSLALG